MKRELLNYSSFIPVQELNHLDMLVNDSTISHNNIMYTNTWDVPAAVHIQVYPNYLIWGPSLRNCNIHGAHASLHNNYYEH